MSTKYCKNWTLKPPIDDNQQLLSNSQNKINACDPSIIDTVSELRDCLQMNRPGALNAFRNLLVFKDLCNDLSLRLKALHFRHNTSTFLLHTCTQVTQQTTADTCGKTSCLLFYYSLCQQTEN